jgi:hypothetical protein
MAPPQIIAGHGVIVMPANARTKSTLLDWVRSAKTAAVEFIIPSVFNAVRRF